MLKGYLYILENKTTNKFYIGSTTDVKRRLNEHLSGKVRATKGILPLELVFQQECSSFSVARKIESKFKRMKRKDFILKVIQDGFIRINV